MRTTPLSLVLLLNLECFTLKELEKIMTTEPRGNKGDQCKFKYGILADMDVCNFKGKLRSSFNIYKKHI